MAQKLSSRKKKRQHRILITLGVFVGLGILAGFLYIPFFQITGMKIQNAQHTDIVSLEHDIQPFIQNYRYIIIPNNNFLFYQKKAITDFVMRTYPSVEHIDIRIDTSRRLIITIKDRKPLGVWCSEDCYLYDTAGILFKKSFTYTGSLYVSWKKDDDVPIGLLDTVSCVELCTDVKFLEFLRSYRIEKAAIHESGVELFSADGYYIKTGLIASTTMVHMKNVAESKPEILQNLEYIDVRFDNKLFYKEKGEGASVDL